MLTRIESTLQRHPHALTHLRTLLEESPKFAKLIWRIRAKQRLHLDYPVDPVPRFGHGKPPHGGLHRLISAHDSAVAELLERALDYTDEFVGLPELPGVRSAQTSWRNGWLPALDMVAHYTLLATRRPQRYLEIGSGESTKLARTAVQGQAISTEIISIDPAPRAEVDGICDRVVRSRLEDADLSVFADVRPGDVVFVDSSHRSFMNSDVSVFFLEVLPWLPAGTLVGIHDVDLPWDYRPEWAIRAYNEQYLLAVYLLARQEVEIVFPARHVAVTPVLADVLAPLWKDPRLPEVNRSGAAFWMTV